MAVVTRTRKRGGATVYYAALGNAPLTSIPEFLGGVRSTVQETSTLVDDPLRDVTRKERRALLLSSVVAIAVGRAGIIPSKIPVLGIEFDGADQIVLLRLLAAIVLYFFIAFLVYGLADFVSWRHKHIDGIRQGLHDSIRKQMVSQHGVVESKLEMVDEEIRSKYRWIIRLPTRIAWIRLALEFLFPLGLGVYAFLRLLRQTIFID